MTPPSDSDDSQRDEITIIVTDTDRIEYVTRSIEVVDGDSGAIERNDP